jgi:hypothetical protein
MGLAFLALLAVTSFGMLAMQIPLDKFHQKGAAVQQMPKDYKSQVEVL